MCEICTSRDFVTRNALEGAAVADPAALTATDLTSLSRSAATVNEVGDAAASSGTAYSVSIGDSFAGSLSSSSDSDWIAVTLEAGQSYVFGMHGTGGNAAGVVDTVLTLRNSSGTSVASNDDLAAQYQNYFSAFSYTATSSGTYYLDAGSFGSNAGTYRVVTDYADASLDTIASYMLDLDWGSASPLVFDVAPGGTITYNVTGLTADGVKLAEWAFEAWAIATGLTFQASTSSSAMIMLDDNQSGAFAGPDTFNSATGAVTQSSVNVGADWLNFYGTEINSYSMSTYIHEIGHALTHELHA